MDAIPNEPSETFISNAPLCSSKYVKSITYKYIRANRINAFIFERVVFNPVFLYAIKVLITPAYAYINCLHMTINWHEHITLR